MSTADMFYMNADVTNQNTEDIDTPMEYTTVRAQPILQEAGDWLVSCIRFSLPLQNVPYMLVRPNEYWVGFSFGATPYMQPVVYNYLPDYIFPNGVWEFSYFTDRVNQAMRLAYNAMVAANPGSPTDCPFIAYNEQIQRFVLYYPESYVNNANVSIWMNNRLQILFGYTNEYFGYQPVTQQECRLVLTAQYTTGSQNRIVPVSASAATPIVGSGGFDMQIPNYTTLPPTYALINQNWQYTIPEKNTNPEWIEWNKIILLSNSLPTVSEYTGSTGNLTQAANAQSGILPALTDFAIDSSVGVQFRGTVVFNPVSQWRFAEFNKAGPLRSFDIRIALQAKNGQLYYPTIPANSAMTIKLFFVRKDFLKKNPEIVYKQIGKII